MFVKTFRYRLYPTKKQARLLNQHLEECRWLWNTLLAERKQAWEDRLVTVSYYDQQAALPLLKATTRPGLRTVHSLVVQDIVRRLQKAFDAFSHRVKAGEKPGYPRFKGPGRYDSLTYAQWGNGISLDASGMRLLVSKVGDVKVISHRPLEGTPKTATLRRTATGKWFVSIVCDWQPTALPATGREVGIDVGLASFATTSDAQTIPTPHFFREAERELGKVERKHQTALETHQAVSASPEERTAWQERQRRRIVVAQVHERTRWRRDNFTHQQSRKVVSTYDLIALEDLIIPKMVQESPLAKSILDAAWNQFTARTACKAAWAGTRCVLVNPAYTSQDGSTCGHRKQDLTLSDRVYYCLACGLMLDRDCNAALNILARGRACPASASKPPA